MGEEAEAHTTRRRYTHPLHSHNNDTARTRTKKKETDRQAGSMNKFLLLVVLASVMASSVSCGTRKLAQNSFPLRFDRAANDFAGEFFDEYIDEADWLPETYEYDSLITEVGARSPTSSAASF